MILAVGFLSGSLIVKSVHLKPTIALAPGIAICVLAIIQPTTIAVAGAGFSTAILSGIVPSLKDRRLVPDSLNGTFEGQLQKVRRGLFNGRTATLDVNKFWLSTESRVNFKAHLGYSGPGDLAEGSRLRFSSDLREIMPGKDQNRPHTGSIAPGGVNMVGEVMPIYRLRKKISSVLDLSARSFPSHLDGILESIAAGDRAGLSADLSAAMRKTGT